jgi:nucleotide sugar dehydrogenase
LLENTFRHVNIALVNEMARFCHELDIDLWDVIGCAATKPFGYHAFHPGPGVGGHCIPIDPNYLSHNVRPGSGIRSASSNWAQEINASMPAYVVQRVQDVLNAERLPPNGATVLLLGVTYKPDIADQRESPAGPLAKHLAAKGAVVSYHDLYIETWRINGNRADQRRRPRCGTGRSRRGDPPAGSYVLPRHRARHPRSPPARHARGASTRPGVRSMIPMERSILSNSTSPCRGARHMP